MPWKPSFPGERPTLGHYVIEWVEDNLARPDNPRGYEPLVFTREQAEFVLRYYEIDPYTGRRIVRRGVLSRPRGWGKSPFVAAICMVEALADVVPDGWDADGRPVGRPWSTLRVPLVQIAAVSEDQVITNTWSSLSEMLDPQIYPPVYDNYPGLELLGTVVNCPVGSIKQITASASTVKGARAVFSAWDQTEEWTGTNGGKKLAKVLADNAAKVGGTYIETPNAFTPGEKSVAEDSAMAHKAILEGRARATRGILWDHREAPGDTDLTDRDSLLEGLRWVYGDSSDDPRGCVIHDPPCEPGWAGMEERIQRAWDPDGDEQNYRANFLGQITHASDAFLSQPDWRSRGTTLERLDDIADGETITLGFDGSRGRAKGKPDATALIGCRVSDGHLFEVFVDEAPDDKHTWEAWQPNITRLEAALADCYDRFRVVAFYADPGRDWRSHVNQWEASYGRRTRVKASVAHPFEWWMTGGRALLVERAVEAFESAVLNGDVTHAMEPRLTAHVLNARRRLSHKRLALGKETPSSIHKIDAAVAAVLAWQARLDAMARGIRPGARPKKTYRVKSLR